MFDLVECRRADDLIDALLPRSDHFRDPHDASRRTEQYIFRGHEDDRFELIPSALRLKGAWIKSRLGGGVWGQVEPNPKDAKEVFTDARLGTTVTEDWTNRDQIQAEVLMLVDFFWFADSSGLPLPEDSRTLRTKFDKLSIQLTNLKDTDDINDVFPWPPSEILSLQALAQHYGVPTRLLDWSRNAYRAAYFAAEKAVIQLFNSKKTPPADPPTLLSIWAFNTEAYSVRSVLPHPFGNRGHERVKIITAPTAGNPNLHVQQGLFTLYQPRPLMAGAGVDRVPLDAAVPGFGARNIFKRFTLPVTEANKLLRLLYFEGVSGANIYAGYKGAAQATMEQRFWNDWDRPGDVWRRFPAKIP